MEIKPDYKKLAIVGGAYATGSALYLVGVAAGIILGLSSLATVAPSDQKDHRYQMKAWGALAISLVVSLSIGAPIMKTGTRLISYASNVSEKGNRKT